MGKQKKQGSVPLPSSSSSSSLPQPHSQQAPENQVQPPPQLQNLPLSPNATKQGQSLQVTTQLQVLSPDPFLQKIHELEAEVARLETEKNDLRGIARSVTVDRDNFLKKVDFPSFQNLLDKFSDICSSLIFFYT